MNTIAITLTQEELTLLFFGLAAAVLLLFILCIVLFVKLDKQKKRYDFFMGTNRKPSYNLESKLESYYSVSKGIAEKYAKLLDMVTDMDKTMKSNIQKVGLIRYNPFDEMGGNLCFALALLDGSDNGVVLNGIHSRTGSFTYAKPIELGVSTYILSDEEIKAVEMAKQNAYQPEHEKVVKVRMKRTFKRRDKDDIMREKIAAAQQAQQAMQNTAPKEHKVSIGDVTEEERALILKEETLAGKIAAAEAILKKREQANQLVEQAIESVEQTEASESGDLLDKTPPRRRARAASMETAEAAPLEETMQAVNQTTEDMETQFVEAIFLEAPKQESDDEPDNEE